MGRNGMSLFIAVYMLLLGCYFYTRTTDNKKLRMANKYAMATMYLSLALMTFIKRQEFGSNLSLLMAALCLAWLGDIFLVFDFGRGGDFFLAGNICFTLYEQSVMLSNGQSFKEFGWTIIVAAAMLIGFIFACRKFPEKIKMGEMKWPMTFYLGSIFMHGITGLCMLILLPGTKFVMMGIGSVLFMISDMILTGYRFIFNNNKWLIRANSLTYFTGLLLIVLSMI